MKEYLVTYEIYINCHIAGSEEDIIKANSYDEAQRKADRFAEAAERELTPSYPGEDVWVEVGNIIEEH